MDTKQFDELVANYRSAKMITDEAEKIEAKYKQQILDQMLEAGKVKYFVEGVGTVSLSEKKSIKVPKTNEDKTLFFAYIDDKYGEEFAKSLVTINSRTLNSFYNEEAAKIEGPEELRMPGIEPPTSYVSLSFRKK